MTVRTCYIDREFASLCLSAAIIEIIEHRWTNHNLTLALPPGWKVFIPLGGEDVKFADNFDQLYDAPLHAVDFDCKSFDVMNHTHQLLCI